MVSLYSEYNAGARVGVAVNSRFRNFQDSLINRTLMTLAAVAFVLCTTLNAEDVKLRQAAVELLERADAASTTPTRPPFTHTVTFRVYAAGSGEAQEGRVKMIWAGPKQRRYDTDLGDFHLINIFYEDQLFVKGIKGEATPAIVRRAMKFMPMHLVRFDHEDTIRSIDDAVVRGRPARCIEFDTTFGTTTNNNEICVDKEFGVMLRFRDGAETEEYSEFSPFSGASLPGRTDIYRNGAQILELHQSYEPLSLPVDMSLFAPPPGATVRNRCQQVREAFGQSMPQPKSGPGDQITDIELAGMIGPDGKVYLPVVMTSDRPDLNQEALQIVRTWVYSPALCDGKPNWGKGTFVLHFQGR